MSTETTSKTDDRPRECRFAIHIPCKRPGGTDYHLVKEAIHNPDGTIESNIRYISNYVRPFWITKRGYQNHTQKKECIPIDHCIRYESTQSDLRLSVARALGKGWSTADLGQLAESPFLYGSDLSSTSFIKHDYRLKWPDAASPYSVAFLDIETDVVHGTNDPIIVTFAFKNKLFGAIQRKFIEGYADPLGRINAAIEKHIRTDIDRNQLELEYILVDDAVELIKETFKRAHAWSPDFIAIWNMDFDIPRIIETLEKYGVDPKDIFSDPKLPEELRFCKYKKGSTKKITASGQVKPKNPSEQWHSLYCPAGFYIIDAMCSYRFIRQGAQEEQSYSLDAILAKVLGSSKLKIPGTEGFEGLELHYVSQTRHPFEYIAYAFMDVIGMMDLEKKTTDLSQALPVQTECTDFARYNSQTKRFSDNFGFFLLDKKDMAIGTILPRSKEAAAEDAEDDGEEDTDDEIEEDDDTNASSSVIDEQDDAYNASKRENDKAPTVLSLRDWIVTLKAHMMVLGLQGMVAENDRLATLIRAMVYDSDAVGAYPSASMVGNVSRATTVKELIDIDGIPEPVFRRHNLNLLQGHVNALEYGIEMHGLPRPQDALKYFDDLI